MDNKDSDFAELLYMISYATGLGFGGHTEHGMRTASIGLCIAEAIGATNEECEAVFYGALLKDIACTIGGIIAVLLPDDEQMFLMDGMLIDPSRIADIIRWLLNLKCDACFPQRIYRLLSFILSYGMITTEMIRAHCEVDAVFAHQLGFPDYVQESLRWYGMAYSRAPRASRILYLSQVVEIIYHFAGADAARDIAEKKRGSRFDPVCVDAFLHLSEVPHFWQRFLLESTQEALLARRPPTIADRTLGNQIQIERVCEFLADFIDLKTRASWHHSRTVAQIAENIGIFLGMDPYELIRLRCCALVHDLGKVAVPASILLKDSPLSPGEEEIMRSHTLYTHQLLRRSSALSDLAEVASAHHEWMNGQGYHRHLRGEHIPRCGRILAVANTYARLTERGSDPDEALREMHPRVDIQFDRTCYEALIFAIARSESDLRKISLRPRRLIDSLTEREVEVLSLLARAKSNPEIAKLLHISRRTVEQHLSSIYGKMGVTSRTAAAVYAIQHGLV